MPISKQWRQAWRTAASRLDGTFRDSRWLSEKVRFSVTYDNVVVRGFANHSVRSMVTRLSAKAPGAKGLVIRAAPNIRPMEAEVSNETRIFSDQYRFHTNDSAFALSWLDEDVTEQFRFVSPHTELVGAEQWQTTYKISLKRESIVASRFMPEDDADRLVALIRAIAKNGQPGFCFDAALAAYV